MQNRNKQLETIAWGALFIWWGVTELVKSFPPGIGLIGVGLILLGLGVANRYTGTASKGVPITLGILSLLWGGLELAGTVLHLPYELPVFPILLIGLGGMMLARELTEKRKQEMRGL